jgi:tetratricopeptide (TPR) repeat protein
VDGVQVLGMVAHALTKAGKSERAKTFLEAALPTVEQIGLVNDKAGALSLIAQEFAQIGELEQVRNLFNEALTVTRRMKDTKAKAMVLGDMAQAMASAGLTHEALEAVMLALDAARMRGRNLVINVLLQWVGWLARDGGEAALQMIHAIEETDGWWSAPTTP